MGLAVGIRFCPVSSKYRCMLSKIRKCKASMDIARLLINLSCQRVEEKADRRRSLVDVRRPGDRRVPRGTHSAIEHVEVASGILATARSASILQ
jgi:hypothetical protein